MLLAWGEPETAALCQHSQTASSTLSSQPSVGVKKFWQPGSGWRIWSTSSPATYHCWNAEAVNVGLTEIQGSNIARLSHVHRAGYKSMLVLQFPTSTYICICIHVSIIMVSLHNNQPRDLSCCYHLALIKHQETQGIHIAEKTIGNLSYFFSIFLLRYNMVSATARLLHTVSEADILPLNYEVQLVPTL